MRSVRLQAQILAIILIVLGLGSIFYQIWYQGVPLTEDQSSPVWTIDTKVTFDAEDDSPVKARMYLPSWDRGFTDINESFISNNYGAKVNSDDDGNRRVTWSARRGNGEETLFYRAVIAPETTQSSKKATEDELEFVEAPELEGQDEVAVKALLKSIREQSADIETFVTEAIKKIDDADDGNVKHLLDGEDTPKNRAEMLRFLLSAAHVPTQTVHVLPLKDATSNVSVSDSLELWLRAYNGKEWLYFDPVNGKEGLPDDHLVWWIGEEPMLDLKGGDHGSVSMSMHRGESAILHLAKTMYEQDRPSFLDTSLHEIPIQNQDLIKVLLMIPVGVLLVVVVRTMVGIETLGTFTPVLIALAFRETQIVWGVALFTSIAAMGLVARSYLEHLKLQRLARLGVLLIFVIMMMILITLFSYKLGFTTGLSVGLFPMVILTMVIERISIAWEERGGLESIKLGVITMITAIFCHLVMVWHPLRYFLFTFPGGLLVLAAAIILMGHYRGYRLTELIRFKALVEDNR